MKAPGSLKRGTLFLLDKPAGLTSHDVVERVRKAIAFPKVGHSGTLDPMATGLLLLCAGGAARLQGFFTKMDKSYEGSIRLGRSTTTYDREGETVGEPRDPGAIGRGDIERAAAEFRGEFLQSPPPYSAKKLQGRKFYEMARRGESVPLLPKKVVVSQLSFGDPKDGLLPFSITCSSGTYVRSIASELGDRLGCGAHLDSLRRTSIGSFRVENAVTLERFEAMPAEERLAPPYAVPLEDVPFPFPRVPLASLEVWKVRKGQAVPVREVEARDGDWVALLGTAGQIVALGQVTPMGAGKISLVKPRIVLSE
ncbi:MAG TPA: tRNA pseudouridine(55) synthase TruB [Thermoanaerobaculia bacterium]|nr:tRNA pseudouridine(55) synthase TruB [Thermoanaerobaculia bacterium]